jgi:hypothetical protein
MIFSRYRFWIHLIVWRYISQINKVPIPPHPICWDFSPSDCLVVHKEQPVKPDDQIGPWIFHTKGGEFLDLGDIPDEEDAVWQARRIERHRRQILRFRQMTDGSLELLIVPSTRHLVSQVRPLRFMFIITEYKVAIKRIRKGDYVRKEETSKKKTQLKGFPLMPIR